MKKNKTIIIGITISLIILLIFLGLTYAYYRTRVVGNENPVTIDTQVLATEITYLDGTAYFNKEEVSGVITGKIRPGDVFTKEFSVKNTGDVKIDYSIKLDEVVNEYNRTEDWIYKLTRKEDVNATCENEGGTAICGIIPTWTEYLVASVDLEPNEVHNYVLTIEYQNLEDIDQSEDMGKELSLRVNIDEGTVLWNSAPAGTLTYALKNNNLNKVVTNSSNMVSIPGQSPSLSTESIIGTTEDDYGTSYYFRGVVDNNYVNYSGMCWRVVRVLGNGHIKLALADEKGLCNADTYSTSNNTSAFINEAAGSNYNHVANNAELGFQIDDLFYENSDIPGLLNEWATAKSLNTKKLVHFDWCSDITNTVSDLTYFNGYNRLAKPANANPTLKCNEQSKISSNIGILSADEYAFAGSSYWLSGRKYTHYLMTNADGKFTWTSTPSEYGTNTYYVWAHTSSGYLNYNISIFNNIAVRPSILIDSKVQVTTDSSSTYEPGTSNNPYVITE